MIHDYKEFRRHPLKIIVDGFFLFCLRIIFLSGFTTDVCVQMGVFGVFRRLVHVCEQFFLGLGVFYGCFIYSFKELLPELLARIRVIRLRGVSFAILVVKGVGVQMRLSQVVLRIWCRRLWNDSLKFLKDISEKHKLQRKANMHWRYDEKPKSN